MLPYVNHDWLKKNTARGILLVEKNTARRMNYPRLYKLYVEAFILYHEPRTIKISFTFLHRFCSFCIDK